MAVRLVKIVNVNGRTGWVPETHPRLVDGSLRRAPSQQQRVTARAAAPDEAVPAPAPEPETAPEELTRPAGNASTDAWRRYAISQGMTEKKAQSQTRTQLRKKYAR